MLRLATVAYLAAPGGNTHLPTAHHVCPTPHMSTQCVQQSIDRVHDTSGGNQQPLFVAEMGDVNDWTCQVTWNVPISTNTRF